MSLRNYRKISLQLPQYGIEKVVEIGPGNVLTGLIKRTVEGIELKNIQNLEQISSSPVKGKNHTKTGHS